MPTGHKYGEQGPSYRVIGQSREMSYNTRLVLYHRFLDQALDLFNDSYKTLLKRGTFRNKIRFFADNVNT